MALPVSGVINTNQINVELRKAGTTQGSLNDSDWRVLATVPSGTISLSNFYGKVGYVPGSASYPSSGTYTWTVPPSVTSISITLIGAAGGNGGYDCSSGSGGYPGWKLTGTYSVTPGQVFRFYIGSGGGNGASSAAGYGGGTSGANNLGYGGGAGGNAGPEGSSGGGGGGGGATVVTVDGVVRIVAGGGGGGGGAGCQGGGEGQVGGSSGSIAGGNADNHGGDGGGGGGGGGGSNGGAAGYTPGGDTGGGTGNNGFNLLGGLLASYGSNAPNGSGSVSISW
jgi:hypothetical protein